MTISQNEFQGLARSKSGKGKTTPPTVKAPKMNKAAKQRLVPYQNPATRSNQVYP